MKFEQAKFAAACGLPSQLPAADRPEIVFSGRSNVGKSSLLNKLCGRKSLARTSSSPGKTVTINFYDCGDTVLVDLPGYGYARVSDSERRRWSNLTDGFFAQQRPSMLLLQLLDCRHAPSVDDVAMLEYLVHHGIPFYAVLTKADKLNKTETAERTAWFADFLPQYGCLGSFFTSTTAGTGIEELKACILAFASEANGEGEQA